LDLRLIVFSGLQNLVQFDDSIPALMVIPDRPRPFAKLNRD